MQAALTTPATRTRCTRTSTRSLIFPRHKGGTGWCSWGLVIRGAAEAEDLEYHPKVALRCQERDPGAAELTAEDHVVLTLGPRNSLIEVRGGDGAALRRADARLAAGPAPRPGSAESSRSRSVSPTSGSR